MKSLYFQHGVLGQSLYIHSCDNLAHFGIPYLPVETQLIKTFRRELPNNQGQLLLIKNLDPLLKVTHI